MVYVPSGTFKMGSDNGDSDEKPVHSVTLDSFWIDRTEVTDAAFKKFVADTRYRTDAEKIGSGYVFDASKNTWNDTQGADWQHPRGPGSNLNGRDDHPVVLVSWNDANAYCQWTGGQLPTEAQWEYAARGPQNYTYPWGNTFQGTQLNFCDKNCSLTYADKTVDDGYADIAPVGSYPSGISWVDALDLAGNVWEWVHDWYGPYSAALQANPTGPNSGTYRVLRGGSWSAPGGDARTANRATGLPVNRRTNIGFRCVAAGPGE